MHLIEPGDISPFPKIAACRGCAFLSALAFYCKLRESIAEDHKIDFAFIRVTNIAQLHIISFCVLYEVAILQKVPRNHIFEPGSPVLNTRPIPEIELLFLSHRADSLTAERRDAIAYVEPFKNRKPTLNAFMGNLKQFT